MVERPPCATCATCCAAPADLAPPAVTIAASAATSWRRVSDRASNCSTSPSISRCMPIPSMRPAAPSNDAGIRSRQSPMLHRGNCNPFENEVKIFGVARERKEESEARPPEGPTAPSPPRVAGRRMRAYRYSRAMLRPCDGSAARTSSSRCAFTGSCRSPPDRRRARERAGPPSAAWAATRSPPADPPAPRPTHSRRGATRRDGRTRRRPDTGERDRRVSRAKLPPVLHNGQIRFVAVPGSRIPVAAHFASETAYHIGLMTRRRIAAQSSRARSSAGSARTVNGRDFSWTLAHPKVVTVVTVPVLACSNRSPTDQMKGRGSCRG